MHENTWTLFFFGRSVPLLNLLAHLILMYWLFWSGIEWDIIHQTSVIVSQV